MLLVSFFLYFLIQAQIVVQGISSKWDVVNCDRNEISLGENESVLLDTTRTIDQEHCFAIKDEDNGDYMEYMIEVDILSLESAQGRNYGGLGLSFNVLDRMNYDYVYLE